MNTLKNISFELCFLCIVLFSFISCEKDNENITQPTDNNNNLKITSSFGGTLYIDGKYVNKTLPTDIKLTRGTYIVSIGVEGNEAGYYRKEVTIENEAELQQITFTKEDKVAPKIWKVLWVSYTKAKTVDGCTTSVSKNYVDIAYNTFLEKLKEIEDNSFQAISWEIVTKNFYEETVTIFNEAAPENDPAYGMNWDKSLSAIRKEINIDDFDLVSFYWPANSEDTTQCSGYKTNFGARAAPAPNGNKIIGIMEFPFINNEFGIQHPLAFVHEWMHTVEASYPKKGFKLPVDQGACCTAHSGNDFGYATNFKDFYPDVIKGKVLSVDRKEYLGIGPEALWIYSTNDIEISLFTSKSIPHKSSPSFSFTRNCGFLK